MVGRSGQFTILNDYTRIVEVDNIITAACLYIAYFYIFDLNYSAPNCAQLLEYAFGVTPTSKTVMTLIAKCNID